MLVYYLVALYELGGKLDGLLLRRVGGFQVFSSVFMLHGLASFLTGLSDFGGEGVRVTDRFLLSFLCFTSFLVLLVSLDNLVDRLSFEYQISFLGYLGKM